MSEDNVGGADHKQRVRGGRDGGRLDGDGVVREWCYDEKRPVCTWMEGRAEGHDGTEMVWRVGDYGGDDGSSMARSTGMVTACCVEEWLDDPDMLPPGVHAPEALAPEVVARIIGTMRAERVRIEGREVSTRLLREVLPGLPDEVPHAHRNGTKHPQSDYRKGPAPPDLRRPLRQPRED